MKNLKLLLACAVMTFFTLGQTWAVSVKDTITLAGFGDQTANSYCTTETSGTTSKGVAAKMNNWNGSSTQIRVNQGNNTSLNASNFYLYNSAAFPGAITKVELVVTTGSVTNNYCQLDTSSTAAISSNPTYNTDHAATGSSGTKSWTLDASDGIKYFRISFAKNGGTVKADYVVVTYEASTDPSVSCNPASLDFGTEVENSDNVSKTFKLTGSNLTDDVLLSVSGSVYRIAATGYPSGVTSLTVSPQSNSIDTTITILAYTGTIGTYNTDNVTISSKKATPEFSNVTQIGRAHV